MKALTLFALLVLSACSTTPPIQGQTVCAGVGDCEETRYSHYMGPGISAEKTVQLMVNSPALIGGKPADPADWPASVYAKAGNSACSATVVGERVVFIASHCVSNGGAISFTAHANQYKARCAHHPEYRRNSTADWALCLVDRPVTGVPFEVLGVNKSVAIGDTLLLSGYGCTKPGGGGGNDGIFRIGEATVKGLPASRNYDIVTKGGAALCFGDSGGSAYIVKGKERFVTAVNSRGDISTMSYLPGVFAKTFGDWAVEWAKTSNNVRMCGLHADALGCRTGEALPQPDGKFEVVTRAACVRGAVKPEYLSKKGDIQESVRKALEQF